MPKGTLYVEAGRVVDGGGEVGLDLVGTRPVVICDADMFIEFEAALLGALCVV